MAAEIENNNDICRLACEECDIPAVILLSLDIPLILSSRLTGSRAEVPVGIGKKAFCEEKNDQPLREKVIMGKRNMLVDGKSIYTCPAPSTGPAKGR